MSTVPCIVYPHIDTAGLIKCGCKDWLAVAELCDGELDGVCGADNNGHGRGSALHQAIKKLGMTDVFNTQWSRSCRGAPEIVSWIPTTRNCPSNHMCLAAVSILQPSVHVCRGLKPYVSFEASKSPLDRAWQSRRSTSYGCERITLHVSKGCMLYVQFHRTVTMLKDQPGW